MRSRRGADGWPGGGAATDRAGAAADPPTVPSTTACCLRARWSRWSPAWWSTSALQRFYVRGLVSGALKGW